jgi:hypothetical protein
LLLHNVEDDANADEDEEDEESPRMFTFCDGFPFRVLPASACVGIPLEPVMPMTAAAAGEDESEGDEDCIICATYALDADIHQSLLEELTKSSTSEDTTYTKVSSKQWELPTKASLVESRRSQDGLGSSQDSQRGLHDHKATT